MAAKLSPKIGFNLNVSAPWEKTYLEIRRNFSIIHSLDHSGVVRDAGDVRLKQRNSFVRFYFHFTHMIYSKLFLYYIKI